MRECTKCHETKSLTEFYKRKQSADGVQRKCKVCVDADYKVYWKKIALQQSEKRRTKQEYTFEIN